MNSVTVRLSPSTPPEPMLEKAIRHRAYTSNVECTKAMLSMTGFRPKTNLFTGTLHRIPVPRKQSFLVAFQRLPRLNSSVLSSAFLPKPTAK
jgi:hypothetical protein